MLTEQENLLDSIMQKIVEELDISPSKYQEAMERFNSLREHLENGDYPATNMPPDIYIQGSFSLGTVIRPYKEGEDSDYDIDIVCRLGQEKEQTEPSELKNDVGNEVKNYAKKNGMKEPKEKRRCWVLKYVLDSNDLGFHVDVLPCLSDLAMAEYISRENPHLEQYANTTIAITNRDDDMKPPQYGWRSGNPKGYAKWFWDINRPGFVIFEKEQKRFLYENNMGIYSSDEAVPNELVRTPLQRVIQILKRHRDIYFAGKRWEKHKPISMIITTLAARLYEGKASQLRSIHSALDYIVNQLILHAGLIEAQYLSEDIESMGLIQRVGDDWYIPNPVNPHNPGDPEEKGENFADRWGEDNHAGAKAFFQWLDSLKQDISKVLVTEGLHNISDILIPRFGKRVTQNAFASLGTKYKNDRDDGILKMASTTGILGKSGDTPVRKHTFYGSLIQK